MKELYYKYKEWGYKNTFFLIISLITIFYVTGTDFGQQVIYSVLKLGYIGSFIAGIFFVSTFTVVPASIILFEFSETYNIFLITLSAGLGTMIGDYVIFRFIKDGIASELKPLFAKLVKADFFNIFKTPYFSWLIPVIGALIIASPLPDELGIALMGISKLKNWQFLTISFLLSCLGIFFIILVSRSI